MSDQFSAFLLAVERLKLIERKAYLSNISRRENSVEHSWHLSGNIAVKPLLDLKMRRSTSLWPLEPKFATRCDTERRSRFCVIIWQGVCDAFNLESGVKMRAMAGILALALTAGCTDLKPLEARIEDMQEQINKLQADLVKSASNATAANKATAASASAASGEAKQAISIGEANTAAIEKLNTKIDQMFRKRPTE